MSFHPAWLLAFPLRRDAPAHALRLLTALGERTPPASADLACLHPEVARYVGDPDRFLFDLDTDAVGSPVTLYRTQGPGRPLHVRTEICQHDDEYAAGGYHLPLWFYALAERPSGNGRRTLGLHGPYRGDAAGSPILADAAGVTEAGTRLPWHQIDEILSQPGAHPADPGPLA